MAVAAEDAAAASTTVARSGLVGEEEDPVAGGLALVSSLVHLETVLLDIMKLIWSWYMPPVARGRRGGGGDRI